MNNHSSSLFKIWAALSFILVFPNGVFAEPSHVVVTMGELSTEVVGPLLKEFTRRQALALPNQIETSGKKDGYKYRAKMRELIIENLFLNLPGDRYSIAFGPQGQVLFRCHLPSAKITGTLKLKAREKSDGGLFGDMFSDLGKIKREYSVKLVGLDTDVLVRVGLVAGQIRVLDTRLEDIRFGKTKVKLEDENDGAGASFINALSGGMIDKMVRKLILKQLQGRQLVKSMTDPVQKLAERLVIPASFVIDTPLGIKTGAAIVDMRTGQRMTTQMVRVDFESDAVNDPMALAPNETALGQMGVPGRNKMNILMPTGFIENIAGALGRKGVFSLSGEQFSVKFQITPGGNIKVQSLGADDEILWRVPIEINLDSRMISGKMTGVVLAKVKTRISPGEGVFLDLVDAKLESLDTGALPMGSMIRGMADKLLAERLADAFPKTPLMATKIPVGAEIELEITRIAVDEDAVRAFGQLQRNGTSVEVARELALPKIVEGTPLKWGRQTRRPSRFDIRFTQTQARWPTAPQVQWRTLNGAQPMLKRGDLKSKQSKRSNLVRRQGIKRVELPPPARRATEPSQHRYESSSQGVAAWPNWASCYIALGKIGGGNRSKFIRVIYGN